MAATTYTLSFLTTNPQGVALEGATILIELTLADYTSTEIVVPEIITLTTNVSGVATVELISNIAGSQSTKYHVRIMNTLGNTVADVEITMPEANADFRDLIV